MLHLVAFPPSRQDLLEQLALAAADDDALVLLDDAVGFSRPRDFARLMQALPGGAVHALDVDLHHAGIAEVSGSINVVGFDGLVALTEHHEGNASWYP